MNHIYKTIFCKATGTFVAVAEFSKSKGKGAGIASNRAKVVHCSQSFTKHPLLASILAMMAFSSQQVLAADFVGNGNGGATGGTAGSTPNPACFLDTTTHRMVCGKATVKDGANTAMAIGNNAKASSTNAIALGNGADATALDSVAIGTKASSAAPNSKQGSIWSVSIGKYAGVNNTSDTGNTAGIAIGLNAGMNMKSGTENVAIGRDAGKNVDGYTNYALGTRSGNNIFGSNNYSLGTDAANDINGRDNFFAGSYAGTGTNGSFNIGLGWKTNQNLQTNGNISMGMHTVSNGGNAIAIGSPDAYNSDNGTLQGQKTQATAANAIALGTASQAAAENAIAQGKGAVVTGKNSIAIGNNAKASSENTVALGSASEATRAALSNVSVDENAKSSQNQVYALDVADQTDKNSIANTVKGSLGAVSVGNDDATRQITNVAAGSDDSDAVNVAQLKAVANRIQTVAGSIKDLKFAGNQGGNVTKNLGETLIIKGELDNAENATAKNTRVDEENGNLVIKMAKELTDLTSVTTTNTNGDSTKIAGDGITITPINLNGGKTAVSLTGKGLDNGGNTITNVAAGAINADSTDAVNGSQIYQQANDIANIIGTSTTVSPNGSITATDIGGTGKNTIDEAIKAINSSANAGWKIDATASTGGEVSNKQTKDEVAKNEIVTFDAGNNIKITHDQDNTISIATKKDVSFDSVTVGGTGGINIDTSGINAGGKTISNIAAGVAGTDAVNVSQLQNGINNAIGTAVGIAVGASNRYTDNAINNIEKGIIGSKDASGKPVKIHTYNVANNSTANNKTIVEAINHMNEEGIQFFHTNSMDTNAQSPNGQTKDSSAVAARSTAIGVKASVGKDAADSLALGSHASVKDGIKNAVALGAGSVANTPKEQLQAPAYKPSHTSEKALAGTGDAVIGEVSVGNDQAQRRITNLAAGHNPTDAVNVSQLASLDDKLNYAYDDLGYRLNDSQENANAGISAAMAMAAMPQAFLPGKSMISGGIASYNGEGAVAVGISKLSDNGRWVLKFNGSADTKGHAGAAVGAGFHWK